MKAAMTCKYMYHVIGILIGLYSILPVIYALLNVAKDWVPFLQRKRMIHKYLCNSFY